MRRDWTYYQADDLQKPVASPHDTMVMEVHRVARPPETRCRGLRTPVLTPREWDAIVIRKIAGESAGCIVLPGPESFNNVDSIAWCPPRSTADRTPGSAEALISKPAAIAFLLTDILGVAHVSWKQRRCPHRGDITRYKLQMEDAGGEAKCSESVELEILIECLQNSS